MSMNRRSFIGSLIGGLFMAAEIAADPEKLLWVPKARTILLPPAPYYYDNKAPITPEMIKAATEGLLPLFKNALVIQRQYNDLLSTRVDDLVIGSSLTIRRPPRYILR